MKSTVAFIFKDQTILTDIFAYVKNMSSYLYSLPFIILLVLSIIITIITILMRRIKQDNFQYRIHFTSLLYSTSLGIYNFVDTLTNYLGCGVEYSYGAYCVSTSLISLLSTSTKLSVSVLFSLLYVSPYGFLFLPIVCIVYSKQYENFAGEHFTFAYLYRVVPLVEDCILLNTVLRGSTTPQAKLSAILLTFKSRWCDSVFLSAIERLEQTDHSIEDIFKVFSTRKPNTVMQASTLDNIGTLIDNWEQLKNSEVFEHFQRIYILALVSNIFGPLGLDFDQRGYTALESEMCKRKIGYGSDTPYLYLLKAAHYIVTTGVSIYNTGSPSVHLFLNGKQSKWYDMQQWLMASSCYLSNPDIYPIHADPEGKSFSSSLYFRRLDDCIDEGKAMQDVIGVKFPRQVASFRHTVGKLMELRSSLLSKAACDTTRELPYSILIAGPPGIGKSSFTDVIFNVFAKYETPHKEILENASSFKYMRNFTAKYWDNFKTSMWCVILDDIAFRNVGISKAGGDSSVMEIIQIINTMPYVPDQAALDDKGRTPLRAQLVIGTTNTEDLNAGSYFSCPSAVLRRFPYVVKVSVKEHLRKENSTLLDADKVDNLVDYIECVPNLWDIHVNEVKTDPDTPSRASKVTVLETSNINEFINWYCNTITKHYNICNNLKQSANNMENIRICSSCKSIFSACPCPAVLQTTPFNSHSLKKPIELVVEDKHFLSGIFNCDYKYYICKYPLQYYHYLDSFYPKHTPRSLTERLILDWSCKKELLSFAPKQYDSIWYAAICGTIASIILIIIKIYKLYTTTTSEMQGSMIPKPIGEEKSNVWYNADIPLSSLFISNKSKCEAGPNITDKVSTNIINITITNSSGSLTKVRALGVQSDIYVTTAHAFKKAGNENISIEVVSTRISSVDSNTTFVLNRRDFIIKDDIMLFRLRGSSSCKNILQYFPISDKFRWTGHGLLLIRSHNDGTPSHTNLKNLIWESSVISNYHVTGPTYTSLVTLASGTCGSPILVDTTGKGDNVIVGIHCAGPQNTAYTDEFKPTSGVKGFSHSLSQEILISMIKQLSPFRPLSQNSRTLGSLTKNDLLKPLHKKSPLNFIEDGTCKVYGSLNVPRAHSKSAVTAHLCRDWFLQHGYEVKNFKPNLNSYVPWRQALLDSTDPVRNIDMVVLDGVTENFLIDILERVDTDELKSMVHPIPLSHAINGTQGVAFIDSVPRSTSAGYPWNHTKTKLAVELPPDEEHQDPITYNSEVLSRVEEIESLYKKGLRASPIFTAHLKDEPVTQSKVDSGKVRIFSGTPLDFTLVVRKQMMGFIRFLQRNRDAFEACPGLIAQSREWHDMYIKLTKFGTKRCIAGDFKAFDKRMACEFMQAAFQIIYWICELSENHSVSDLKIIKGFATDTCNAFTNFNGDLIEFFGSNPSGHPLTVIINSLVNSLYMRYAYAILVPEDPQSFVSNVVLRTYGDDNVMNSNSDAFNHTSIAKVLGDIGIVYTMADKAAKSVPFIDIKDVTFLKRRWRFDSDVGQFMAELEHDSINKMLTTWVQSRSVSPQEQALSTIETACREYFYYGKETFNEKRALLSQAIVDNDLSFLMKNPLPTWDELLESYHNAHRKSVSSEENIEMQAQEIPMHTMIVPTLLIQQYVICISLYIMCILGVYFVYMPIRDYIFGF